MFIIIIIIIIIIFIIIIFFIMIMRGRLDAEATQSITMRALQRMPGPAKATKTKILQMSGLKKKSEGELPSSGSFQSDHSIQSDHSPALQIRPEPRRARQDAVAQEDHH
jgi:hypothetical protein